MGLITPRSIVQIYPPLPSIYHPRFGEAFLKTIWSIRNLSDNTRKTYSKLLKRLSKECDVFDTVQVEKFVFEKDCSKNTKTLFFDAYGHFCKANEIEWTRPSLKAESVPIKIPTEERINLIISTATEKYSLVFQISKHGLPILVLEDGLAIIKAGI